MRSARLLAVTAVLAALAACSRKATSEPIATVTVDQVAQLVGRPGVTIVDANTLETFRRNHVPGARYWRSGPLPSLLPADRDAPVVFYCSSPG